LAGFWGLEGKGTKQVGTGARFVGLVFGGVGGGARRGGI